MKIKKGQEISGGSRRTAEAKEETVDRAESRKKTAKPRDGTRRKPADPNAKATGHAESRKNGETARLNTQEAERPERKSGGARRNRTSAVKRRGQGEFPKGEAAMLKHPGVRGFRNTHY